MHHENPLTTEIYGNFAREVRVVARCPKCTGEMKFVFGNEVRRELAEKGFYLHVCEVCDNRLEFRGKYPRIEYRPLSKMTQDIINRALTNSIKNNQDACMKGSGYLRGIKTGRRG